MAKIKFMAFDGTETEIDADNGTSIMRAAVNNGVPGIIAECGGACCCATCHVYFDSEWSAKLPEPHKTEKDMLEFVMEQKETSRLACQIEMSDDLDGIIVYTPQSQY
ncbi:MAG: 2Fe-2S iron-sulfur cluster-binding protein [Gammaproteobacteria bacterium]